MRYVNYLEQKKDKDAVVNMGCSDIKNFVNYVKENIDKNVHQVTDLKEYLEKSSFIIMDKQVYLNLDATLAIHGSDVVSILKGGKRYSFYSVRAVSIFTEIPYETIRDRFMDTIKDIVNITHNGKKISLKNGLPVFEYKKVNSEMFTIIDAMALTQKNVYGNEDVLSLIRNQERTEESMDEYIFNQSESISLVFDKDNIISLTTHIDNDVLNSNFCEHKLRLLRSALLSGRQLFINGYFVKLTKTTMKLDDNIYNDTNWFGGTNPVFIMSTDNIRYIPHIDDAYTDIPGVVGIDKKPNRYVRMINVYNGWFKGFNLTYNDRKKLADRRQLKKGNLSLYKLEKFEALNGLTTQTKNLLVLDALCNGIVHG